MASDRSVSVGGVEIGGGAPVVVQSMTLTKTHDVPATTAQIASLVSAGCEIVPVAVPKLEDAEALPRIVRFSPVPIIADIHFNASLALKAIEAGVHAVRINPGNIGGPDKVAEVVRAAKKAGIPMRIGANSGSLPKHLESLAQEGPVGQVGQNIVVGEVCNPGFGAPALGDVLMRADQPAVRHGEPQNRNAPTVGKMQDLVDPVTETANSRLHKFLRLDPAVDAACHTRLEDLAQCGARLQQPRIQSIHLRVAGIGYDNALVWIEHAQPLRHIRQRRLQTLRIEGDLSLRACNEPLAGAAGQRRNQADPEHRRSGAGNGHGQRRR